MWPKKEVSGRQQEKREEREIDTQKHTQKKQHWAIGVKLKLTIAITIKITIAITIPIPKTIAFSDSL